MFHDRCRRLNGTEPVPLPRRRPSPVKQESGGLLFLRRITPRTRRNTVYFCSGAYTLSLAFFRPLCLVSFAVLLPQFSDRAIKVVTITFLCRLAPTPRPLTALLCAVSGGPSQPASPAVHFGCHYAGTNPRTWSRFFLVVLRVALATFAQISEILAAVLKGAFRQHSWHGVAILHCW